MELSTAPHPPRPSLRNRGLAGTFNEAFDTIVWILLLFTIVNLGTARYIVDGISMEPNFHTGEYILVSRASYLIGEPARGDIVVFHYPNNPNQDYIKRMIGLPGDTVEIRDQQVYVNGEPLNEPYINELCSPASCPNEIWEVPAGSYFVMGDNRNHSSDSRAFDFVERRFIVGEALVRYAPLNAIGPVIDIAYPN